MNSEKKQTNKPDSHKNNNKNKKEIKNCQKRTHSPTCNTHAIFLVLVTCNPNVNIILKKVKYFPHSYPTRPVFPLSSPI